MLNIFMQLVKKWLEMVVKHPFYQSQILVISLQQCNKSSCPKINQSINIGAGLQIGDVSQPNILVTLHQSTFYRHGIWFSTIGVKTLLKCSDLALNPPYIQVSQARKWLYVHIIRTSLKLNVNSILRFKTPSKIGFQV